MIIQQCVKRDNLKSKLISKSQLFLNELSETDKICNQSANSINETGECCNSMYPWRRSFLRNLYFYFLRHKKVITLF